MDSAFSVSGIAYTYFGNNLEMESIISLHTYRPMYMKK